jgi:acyl-coenzyme A thioesterase PaaI-like protein
MKLLLNLYPPYLGAGVRVYHISKDYRHIKVKMPLYFFNRNYFGTHFGGSIYSMTDPFYVIMLVNNLGKDYIVWDKSAEIEFLKPGKGTLYADFFLTEEELDLIRSNTQNGKRFYPEFWVEVRDEAGDQVARIKKTLYVKRKA